MKICINGIKFPMITAIAAAALFTAAPLFAAPDADAEAGIEALKAGNVKEAKARFEDAIKRDPSNHDAVISYVSTLPTAAALKTMDSLSRVQAAPARVKAQCLRFLGDHRFIREDYKKAAEFYQQAAALDNSSTYRHLRALSLAQDGRQDAAREIWASIAADTSDPMSEEAALMLASIKQSSNQAAIITTPPEKSPESPANINEKPAKTDEKVAASTPVQQVATVNKPTTSANPQQSATTSQQSVSTDKQPASANQPPADKQPTSAGQQPISTDKQPAATVNQQPIAAAETLFTVQVGAFGSKDNADNLVKRLSGTYKDITVATTINNDQTLYRVRIGTFKNREDAVAFADKLTTSAGLSARVVEK